MNPVSPIIFSGNNDRAVIALCRFLKYKQLTFFVIASNSEDAIYKTSWRDNILLCRETSELSLQLMHLISNSVREKGTIPALCPTSEFLNTFALAHKDKMRNQGWHDSLPNIHIYQKLTSKVESSEVITPLTGITPPPTIPVTDWRGPCILKPKTNVLDGETLYPLLCRTKDQLEKHIEEISPQNWFAQPLIDGQSYYLCAYIDKSGGWNTYWQENLIQQPGGKSIVLSRTCRNPGLDEPELMEGLHKLEYYGPFMMEVIRDHGGELHFIEVNPRFWGPLELARRAHPELLERYQSDLWSYPAPPTGALNTNSTHWYSWAYGAQQKDCHVYPGLSQFAHPALVKELLIRNDVYALPDTKELHNRH